MLARVRQPQQPRAPYIKPRQASLWSLPAKKKEGKTQSKVKKVKSTSQYSKVKRKSTIQDGVQYSKGSPTFRNLL